MNPGKNRRNSTCAICGTRLSVKTSEGDIHWNLSLVDDKGIYCDTCYAKIVADRSKQDVQPDEK